jgi:hypothetical protein
MGYMGLYRSTKPYAAGQIKIPASDQAPSAGIKRNHMIIVGPGVGVAEVSGSSGPCTAAAIDATSPRVASLAATLPELKRGNSSEDVGVYGGVAACCNDTMLVNETNVTALGGGTYLYVCVDVMLFFCFKCMLVAVRLPGV